MKGNVVSVICRLTKLSKKEVEGLVEIPPTREMGDYAFPCFVLSKRERKKPGEIASELAEKISDKEFEKVEARGAYVNFFVDRKSLSKRGIEDILKKQDKYGSSNLGKGKNVVIEFSSPNIAKPFGIGHLRSTLIGSSISNISSFLGFKTTRINHLGDWGTPFGKILAGYEKFGSEKKLNENPIKHLYDVYVKTSKNKEFEKKGPEYFKRLEKGDRELVSLWKKFRELSLREFNEIYSTLGIKFDVVSGESDYDKKTKEVLSLLEEKKLLKDSEGAQVVELEKEGLGVVLIKKSDGATLYATRDLATALERYKKYKFDKMIYEVGSEQKLYFKQLFKVLELMGNPWSENCFHVEHGLYLDSDGKKFATRKGKTVFMKDIIEETKELAKKEILKREKISGRELEERSLKIALSAIIYGDLKNYRANDVVFDLERFLSFEGNTGPYLLYTYARARSILRKSGWKKFVVGAVDDVEKSFIFQLSLFPEVVVKAYEGFAPNIIANYSYNLCQRFSEFYHSHPVLGSEREGFRLALVESFCIVLRNALSLLGIEVLEEM